MENCRNKMSRWIFWTVLVLAIILIVLAGWDLCKREVSKKHNDVPLASKNAGDNTFFVHVFVHNDKKETDQCGPCGKKKSAHKKRKSVPKAKTPAETFVEAKPLLEGVDPDFGKTKMVFTPLPEKETESTKVGKKIYVIRQSPPPVQYYGGGGYYGGNVTYGQQYVPPPQTVFVPTPPVIVPAPSVVTPAGGYSPQGSTGGHGPAGTTGAAL